VEPLFGVLFSLNKGKSNHGEWVIACLQGAWPKLLGERLAAVCRPARLEGANLQIEILDQAWESAVRSVKAEVVERLRTATADEVRSVSFSRQPAAGSRQ
jgi:hypothetical protein